MKITEFLKLKMLINAHSGDKGGATLLFSNRIRVIIASIGLVVPNSRSSPYHLPGARRLPGPVHSPCGGLAVRAQALGLARGLASVTGMAADMTVSRGLEVLVPPSPPREHA